MTVFASKYEVAENRNTQAKYKHMLFFIYVYIE